MYLPRYTEVYCIYICVSLYIKRYNNIKVAKRDSQIIFHIYLSYLEAINDNSLHIELVSWCIRIDVPIE